MAPALRMTRCKFRTLQFLRPPSNDYVSNQREAPHFFFLFIALLDPYCIGFDIKFSLLNLCFFCYLWGRTATLLRSTSEIAAAQWRPEYGRLVSPSCNPQTGKDVPDPQRITIYFQTL